MADQLPTWWDSVKAIFDRAGVPPAIWYPIAVGESGGDPRAANEAPPNLATGYPGEASYGLFQLNTQGGQGAGYTRTQLQDPAFNASVAVSAIATAYRQYGNDIVEVARHSGHPGLVDPSDRRLQTFKELQAQFVQGAGNLGLPNIFDPNNPAHQFFFPNQDGGGTNSGPLDALPNALKGAITSAFTGIPKAAGEAIGKALTDLGVSGGAEFGKHYLASEILLTLVILFVVIAVLAIAFRATGAIVGGAGNVQAAAGLASVVPGPVGAAGKGIAARARAVRALPKTAGAAPKPTPIRLARRPKVAKVAP